MAVPKAVQKQADEAKRIQQEIIDKRSKPSDVTDPPAIVEPPDDWEKRYKGMQKTFDKTVTGLRDDNEGLNSRNAELEAKLEEAQIKEPAVQEPVFSEEEIKEYGEDFLKMVARVGASRTASPEGEIAGKLDSLNNRFDGLEKNQFKTAEDKFFAELDRVVPSWEDINKRDGFKNWLAEDMPLTGRQRQSFLDEAHARLDAPAAIGFFTAWLGGSTETHDLDTVPAPHELVVGEVDTDIITQQDIKNFYEELKLGKWKGREDEARQNELKIFKAQRENRIK